MGARAEEIILGCFYDFFRGWGGLRRFHHSFHRFAQLQHLQRTLRPVMPPAHNHVAPSRRMLMQQKIPALILKLNKQPLQPSRCHHAHCLAVRIAVLHSGNSEPQVTRHGPKQHCHSGLVRRTVNHRRVIHQLAIEWLVTQYRRSRRRGCARRSQQRSLQCSRPPSLASHPTAPIPSAASLPTPARPSRRPPAFARGRSPAFPPALNTSCQSAAPAAGSCASRAAGSRSSSAPAPACAPPRPSLETATPYSACTLTRRAPARRPPALAGNCQTSFGWRKCSPWSASATPPLTAHGAALLCTSKWRQQCLLWSFFPPY